MLLLCLAAAEERPLFLLPIVWEGSSSHFSKLSKILKTSYHGKKVELFLLAPLDSWHYIILHLWEKLKTLT